MRAASSSNITPSTLYGMPLDSESEHTVETDGVDCKIQVGKTKTNWRQQYGSLRVDTYIDNSIFYTEALCVCHCERTHAPVPIVNESVKRRLRNILSPTKTGV